MNDDLGRAARSERPGPVDVGSPGAFYIYYWVGRWLVNHLSGLSDAKKLPIIIYGLVGQQRLPKS